jgi:hypothetical protein
MEFNYIGWVFYEVYVSWSFKWEYSLIEKVYLEN